MQREFPADRPAFFGGFAGGVPGVIRQAGRIPASSVIDLGEGVGGVEQVFRELGGQLRQFFHDGLEARLLFFRQFGAAEAGSRGSRCRRISSARRTAWRIPGWP